MAQLICKNLSLGYEKQNIVSNLNFEINAGDYLCIIGENGSGKSTLIKTLLGLLSPYTGQVLTGEELKSSQIGYLPQQSEDWQDFPASVWEVVLSGCQNRQGIRPFYNKNEKETALENIRKMGVFPLLKKCFRELSGGQKQRVLLARALCAAEKMLLLDEPVTGLDPKASAKMYEIIESLNKDDGITIIMVSHDMDAVKYANHILHMGEKVFFGSKDEYLKTNMFGFIGESRCSDD